MKPTSRRWAAGLLVAIAGLVWFSGSPTVLAQEDSTSPTISSIAITSDPDDDVYGIDDTIEVMVTFSEDVTVTGAPRLRLDMDGSGKAAEYNDTSGSTVVFSYAVAENDSDDDGIAIGANSLTLNGGTIRDAADNDADLSHDALSAQAGHEVDGVRPSLRGFYLSPKAGETETAPDLVVYSVVMVGSLYLEASVLIHDTDYSIVARYQAEFRGVVQYYLLALNVFRFGKLQWVMNKSLAKTLANKHKTTAAKIFRRYKSTVQTEHGGRACLEVEASEGMGNPHSWHGSVAYP